MSLTTRNSGEESFNYSEAMHSYFSVDDIQSATIDGLRNTTYADKLENMALFNDADIITFVDETDRVYQDTDAACLLTDNSSGHQIRVEKSGSSIDGCLESLDYEKAKAMKDFGNEEWREMICIETANVAPQTIKLAAGDQHTMSLEIHSGNQ